ncbi:hypothetical protein [Pseudomonas sp. GL-RE-20]|uniref:hypothetical protein n=1 Tax=Pseudomonas sp. GL-RE-20 TaxID=2832372 RepID=UPI001CBEC39F|nr:hypothetical protein [Pseudomonas sp. GL-RE-20]
MLKYLYSSAFLINYVFFLIPFHLWLSLNGYAPLIYLSFITLIGVAITIVAIFLSPHRKNLNPTKKTLKYLIPFFIFTTYMLLVQVINFSLGDRIDSYGRGLFQYNLGALANNIAWFIIGMLVMTYILRTSKHRAPFITWLAITLFYLSVLNLNTLSIDFSSTFEEKGSIYLVFADLYAVIAMITISTQRKNSLFLGTFLISLLTLYFLNSRASMVLFGVSFIIPLLIKSSFRWKAAVIIAATIAGYLVLLASQANDGGASRMLAFFSTDYTNDGSYIGRMIQFDAGLSHISANPVMGGYNSIHRDFHNHGAYMHNILSFWQMYGVVAFIFACALFLLVPLKLSIKSMLKKSLPEHPPQIRAITLLSTYIVLQIAFSRSYSWSYPWLLFGMIAVYNINLNKTQTEIARSQRPTGAQTT